MNDDLDTACGLDPDGVADLIDDAYTRFRRGQSTPLEAVDAIQSVTLLLVRMTTTPADEVAVVIEYARDAVERIAACPLDPDPVLVDYFDAWMRNAHLQDDLDCRLQDLVEGIEGRIADREPGAIEELRDLCRRGRWTHWALFGLRAATPAVLHAAHRAGVPEALGDAVSPEHDADAQIASRRDNREGFVLALDLLAHLAAHPTEGADARSVLLDLARFVETAGEAVTRLPMHLLDEGERRRLLEVHERRVDLFDGEPLFIPSLAMLRDDRVIRGAVWQAFDAARIA